MARLRIAGYSLDRATGDNRQIKRVDEQFGLELLLETGPRIDNRFSGDRIGRVFVKVAHSRRHSRQFLQRNARELPCHRRGIDLKKREPQLGPRTQKNLRSRENNT